MIGLAINQYKITAKIGEGGMGEVYLATDTKLDRQVALKFLPRHFSSDEEARARFQREAKALAALNHPNIVHVYDVSEHDGQPFIAMEYIDGQSLRELTESGDVAVEKALDILGQAAEGLAAAHKRDIVHRDIKSENIVISSEGRVKIMDFGLATWQGVTKVTAEGSTLGTRAYMSPEQSSGQDVDHRTDLWSLGIVLYELVTGRLPFTGDHDAAIAYSIANEIPEPIARYKSGSPDELQRIVSKCLAKNVDERYQSAADLTADVRAMGSASVAASGASPARTSSNRRTLISVGAVLGIAVIATVTALIWNPFQSPTEEANAGRKMLAVLPFENLGPDDQEYFADGMTEEIISRLANVSGLGVISRTSVMRYKDTVMSLREIGAELGVDYVLEGTIRWDQSGDTDYVRITPQLIQVSDDTHLWADRIERPLRRIFDLQADIAEQVVTALNIALLEPERAALSMHPTGNLAAYDYFLRGQDLLNQFHYGGTETQISAISMFEQAIAVDSQYALAYAALSRALSGMYRNVVKWEQGHTWDTLLTKSRETAENALRYAPELPEARLVMEYYYYSGFRDYDAAMSEFAQVEARQPNNSDLLLAIGLVKRRQGRWVEAYATLKRALDLDPTSNEKRRTFAGTCRRMRRFHEAIEVLDKGMILYPHHLGFYIDKVDARLRMTTDYARRQAIYDSGATRDAGMEIAYRSMSAEEARDYDSLVILTPMGYGPLWTWADSLSVYVEIAELHRLANRVDLSRAYADSALACTEGQNDSVLTELWGLSFAYALLERKEEALAWAKGHEDRLYLVYVYIGVGEHEQAIDILDQLLSEPGRLSVTNLQFDYSYDPLRDNPRFQTLIDRGDIVF